jgi:hypothetical protein
MILGWGVLVGLVFLSGCGGSDPSVEQTLVVENATLSTGIAQVRGTVTFMADQMMQTIESLATATHQVQDQRARLAATLVASGIDLTAIYAVQPNPGFVNPPTPAQAQFALTPFATPTSALVITPPGQPSPIPQSTQPAAIVEGPNLLNIVTSAGVDNNDCALGSVNLFNTDAQSIYAVATAVLIEPGITLGATWYQESNRLIDQSFTPDFAIDGECIWFYVTPVDIPFNPGLYSVQLTINSLPVGAAIPFSIQGELLVTPPPLTEPTASS